MRKLLIASHGKLASGLKSSLEILLGEANNVEVIDAYVDESRLEDVMEAYFQTISDDDQVILLSDMYGGSVNQTMFRYLNRKNTLLVSGINLAFVIDLAMDKEHHLTKEELLSKVEEARTALMLVEDNEDDEVKDDFF